MSRLFRLGFIAPASCALVLGVLTPARAQDTHKPSKLALDQAKANNEFAFDLFRHLLKEAKPGENVVFSPFSIRTALAMTYAGARGQTAEQMAKALRFDQDQSKFHPALAELTNLLRPDGKTFPGELRIANSIWYDRSVQVFDPFKQLVAKYYESGLQTVNFRESEVARGVINEWVAANTKSMIQNLLPPGSVSSDTKAVLANAIYFKAGWGFTFDKKLTTPSGFRVSDDRRVEVPMMQVVAALNHATTDSADIVEIPYAGDQFSTILIVPKDGSSINQALRDVPQNIDRWPLGSRTRKVTLRMPRFKLGSHAHLVEPLRSMGMEQAFSRLADFSGMDSSSAPIRHIYHKALLDADEVGASAAAATAVVKTVSPLTEQPVTADRGFVFLVRENRQGAILLAAAVNDPKN